MCSGLRRYSRTLARWSVEEKGLVGSSKRNRGQSTCRTMAVLSRRRSPRREPIYCTSITCSRCSQHESPARHRRPHHGTGKRVGFSWPARSPVPTAQCCSTFRWSVHGDRVTHNQHADSTGYDRGWSTSPRGLLRNPTAYPSGRQVGGRGTLLDGRRARRVHLTCTVLVPRSTCR